jgi:hypothetical protein
MLEPGVDDSGSSFETRGLGCLKELLRLSERLDRLINAYLLRGERWDVRGGKK